ncbi:MAG: hypothetical protein ACPG06_09435 [Alphaproteobacteria bacterium]
MSQHYVPTPEQRAAHARRTSIAMMKEADHLSHPPLRHHRYSLTEARHIKQVMPHGRFKPLLHRHIFE